MIQFSPLRNPVRLASLMVCLVLTISCLGRCGDPMTALRISVRSEAKCKENLIKLSDIADLSGSEAILQTIKDLPLAPAPTEAKPQKWTQADIKHHLQLRGYQPDSFRWAGAESCIVKKVQEIPVRKEFVSTGPAPIHQVQAQRNVEQAIAAYLQIQSNSNTQWKVQAEAPKEHAQALYQRRTIQGVAGGAAPWVGKQTFRLLLVTSKGEEEIEVQADVSIPPMVVVAVGPLRPGQRVVEKDLQYMPLPANSKTSLEDSYTDLRDVVGKELRRSMATHQVISRQDLGAPRVINANELIEVEVVSGSIVIQTGGRSLEPGGIGDAIQIEVLPQKKKLIAQVVGERKVQVSSNAVR